MGNTYRTATIWTTGLFGLFFCLWILQFLIPRPSDHKKYHELLEKKTLAASQSYSPTKQQRSGVRKEIWLAQEDGSRLHYRILSATSMLTLTPIQNKVEVVEALQGVKCWMQEKVYASKDGTSMQQTRYFEAQNGLYRYNSAQLIAQQVLLSVFRLPGLLLPSEPEGAMLKGIAERVVLTFGGKIPQFQATGFKATYKEQL